MDSDVSLEVHTDANEKKIHFVSVQDVEPILDQNASLRGEAQKSDWGRHIASIPNVIFQQWHNEAYLRGEVPLNIFSPEMDRVIARKLQDPANKYLLTYDPMTANRIGWGSK